MQGPLSRCLLFFFFFFNDTATTEIYTLSLHDALPTLRLGLRVDTGHDLAAASQRTGRERDRKSTRLNSSHSQISYAVFCLKKTLPSSDRHPARLPPGRPHTTHPPSPPP